MGNWLRQPSSSRSLVVCSLELLRVEEDVALAADSALSRFRQRRDFEQIPNGRRYLRVRVPWYPKAPRASRCGGIGWRANLNLVNPDGSSSSMNKVCVLKWSARSDCDVPATNKNQ